MSVTETVDEREETVFAAGDEGYDVEGSGHGERGGMVIGLGGEMRAARWEGV